MALAFKKKFPKYELEYQDLCKKDTLKINCPILQVVSGNRPTKFVISFPTKDHYKNPSKVEYLEKGLQKIKPTIQKLPGNYSIAVPKLGAGCGGIDEKVSINLIELHWGDLTQDILLYVGSPYDRR